MVFIRVYANAMVMVEREREDAAYWDLIFEQTAASPAVLIILAA